MIEIIRIQERSLWDAEKLKELPGWEVLYSDFDSIFQAYFFASDISRKKLSRIQDESEESIEVFNKTLEFIQKHPEYLI